MIYFIQGAAGDVIKIGTAKNVGLRLAQLHLSCGEPLRVLGVMEGGFSDEASLHQRFSHLNTAGEWYQPGDDLLTFIAEEAIPWEVFDEEERCRVTTDLPENVRRALYICAARKGLSVGEVIEQLVLEGLPDDVALADKSISEGDAGPRPKRGRRPKSD